MCLQKHIYWFTFDQITRITDNFAVIDVVTNLHLIIDDWVLFIVCSAQQRRAVLTIKDIQRMLRFFLKIFSRSNQYPTRVGFLKKYQPHIITDWSGEQIKIMVYFEHVHVHKHTNTQIAINVDVLHFLDSVSWQCNEKWMIFIQCFRGRCKLQSILLVA